MKEYISSSQKTEQVRRIINEALFILEKVGVPFAGKTEKALQSMAMSFLSVAGVKKSWSEAKNIEDGRKLTTREIIKDINTNYEENISSGSYDDIRRKHLSLLLLNNLIINRGNNPDSSSSDPTRGYSLDTDFKNLIKKFDNNAWSKDVKTFIESRKINVNIPELHNQIFDFLAEWSDSTRSENRFFYIRTREDERFRKGYWFLGDENYIAISFWSGGDALNKTPNVYLQINFKGGIDAYLVARDSDNKKKYFDKLASQLKDYKSTSKGIWKKQLYPKLDNKLLSFIEEFIKSDKKIIDDYLSSTLESVKNPDNNLLDDEFSSKFGFIEEEQFYKLRSRVESRKFNDETYPSETPATENNLPISLASISIEKFQGIEKTSLTEELNADAQWIFLTGENGVGKTSVLQAIALGLTNYEENREYIKERSKIAVGYKKSNIVILNSSVFSFNEEFKSLNKNFIGYGPIRLNSQASSSENQESKNSSNIYNLFQKDGLLKNINYLFKISRLKNNFEFENLKKAVIKILDNRIIDIKITNDGEVKYWEGDAEGYVLGENGLEQLATGFQSLINLVGDVISRFSKEFPTAEYLDYEGIIIIDELENHLHPIFQKTLPGSLSMIFPKIQFITSVHSPIPLLGAPPKSIIIKVNRNHESQITLEKVTIDNIEELNPNILFTSPIFGFSSIINDNLTDFKKLRTEDTWEEVKKTDILDKELLQLYNSRTK